MKLATLSSCLLVLLSATAQGAGPLQRVPNTTLQMPLTPPVFGFMVTNAFGSLAFTNPLEIVSPPGETNRLFIVEQAGRVVVITNLAAPNRTIFLDITSEVTGPTSASDERGLLSMAFHPDYASNGLFFLDYTGTATTTQGANALHDILARFQVSPTNPNQGLTNSEVRLIKQYDVAPNHNGGCLRFGADGYLYVGLGDEGGANGQYGNAQRIDKDFYSAIMRLDVDKLPGNLPPNPHPASTTNYAIPSDNPFIGATNFNGTNVNPTNVRTEFWAVGMRNPWRFSFDQPTGYLYCGDVGQSAWEEVDIITRGGNYGWNYREGAHPGPVAAPTNFISIDPIYNYAHGSATNQGYCIIGGVVYHGTRVAQLLGQYVFGDYVAGYIWTFNYDGTNVTGLQRIVASEPGITGFGTDPSNGDVLMANQSLGTIRRLTYTTNFTGTPIPPTLAATGVFSNTTTLMPNTGITPYDINVPFWSDNAIKTRWFSVPATNSTIGFNPTGSWTLPPGTVWIKHFDLQMTNGVPSSAQRIETRLLIKNTNSLGVYGVTYRWGGSLTNATLVPQGGMDDTFVINDGGIMRTQVWHYPGWAECLTCHTAAGGYALGFNTPQMNHDYNYGSTVTNEISALSQAGYFTTNVPFVHPLLALASPTNTAVSLEYRVRSYLTANCVQCHQPGGVTSAYWDARINTPGPQAGIINGLLYDNGGDSNNVVIDPGSPATSTLFNRVANLGPDHMPPLATSLINTQAVALLSAWITNALTNYQSFSDWQVAKFGSTNFPNAAMFADPDGDGAVNYLEYLTGTDPLNAASFWKIALAPTNGNVNITYPQIANRGFEVQATTNISDPSSWSPLPVAGNDPFFSISNLTATVSDPLPTNAAKFYRVRVFEP